MIYESTTNVFSDAKHCKRLLLFLGDGYNKKRIGLSRGQRLSTPTGVCKWKNVLKPNAFRRVARRIYTRTSRSLRVVRRT